MVVSRGKPDRTARVPNPLIFALISGTCKFQEERTWPTYTQAEVLDHPRQEVKGRTHGQSCPKPATLRRSERKVNKRFTLDLGKHEDWGVDLLRISDNLLPVLLLRLNFC